MVSLLLWTTLLALCGTVAAAENPVSTLQCEASTFKDPAVPGAKILSVSADVIYDVGADDDPQGSGIEACEVNVTLTHPGADDSVLVQTWLPLTLKEWNGRFLATGGGGWKTGYLNISLTMPILNGYAGSSTDGGHEGDVGDVSWALDGNGSVNWNLLQNFASRSSVDLIYVGKSITKQYFRKAPHHSYWTGCSTGGRQGHLIAQRYPELVDGILANAPAVGMVNLLMGDYYPQIVMREEGALLSNCEWDWFLEKAIEKCDGFDGVEDGIIEDPGICTFEPESLVGQTLDCNDQEVEITKAMASVVRKVLEPPKTPRGQSIGLGLPHGTPATALANITINADGSRSPNPFDISNSFLQNLLLKDPDANTSTLTSSEFFAAWEQASEQYGWMLNTDTPNLSSLRDSGTKLLLWHGLSDQIIVYENSVQYYQKIAAEMGGAKAVNEFYRLFLAPGVEHCGGGDGPIPTHALGALEKWVEEGEAPERLEAETTDEDDNPVTRDLCLWPKKSKYTGVGDGKQASSWTCEGGDDE